MAETSETVSWVEPGQGIARLEREIKNARAALRSGITNRRQHPSYGYTKAGLRADYARLKGLLEAWLLVTGRWSYPGRVDWGGDMRRTVNDRFDVHLLDLDEMVRES